MENFFQYGETEIAYLKQVDKRMAEVIDRIGKVERRVIPDLFAAHQGARNDLASDGEYLWASNARSHLPPFRG